MPVKIACLLFLLLPTLTAGADELIRFSLLERSLAPVQVQRDPFQAKAAARPRFKPLERPAPETEISEKPWQLMNLQYCGFLLRREQKTALLLVAGEHLAVEEGQEIPGGLRILAIDRSALTIEITADGSRHEIPIRED